MGILLTLIGTTWAGTETAARFEGYLEGAVRAAERAVDEIIAAP